MRKIIARLTLGILVISVFGFVLWEVISVFGFVLWEVIIAPSISLYFEHGIEAVIAWCLTLLTFFVVSVFIVIIGDWCIDNW